jgi:hypothetical protein
MRAANLDHVADRADLFRDALGRQIGGGRGRIVEHGQRPNLSAAKANNSERRTGRSAMQCRSSPVSSQSLPKTGIFGIAAGDFREFQPPVPGIGTPETDSKITKARH